MNEPMEDASDSKQPASNPTAWERVAFAATDCVEGHVLWQSVVLRGDAIRIAEEHAAAAVKDLEARVVELERERDEARAALLKIEIGIEAAKDRDEQRSSTAWRETDLRQREQRAARAAEYAATGRIPTPPSTDSWLEYLAAHQHVGNRGCWMCEAAKYARAERAVVVARAEKAEARVAELERERDEALKRDQESTRYIVESLDLIAKAAGYEEGTFAYCIADKVERLRLRAEKAEETDARADRQESLAALGRAVVSGEPATLEWVGPADIELNISKRLKYDIWFKALAAYRNERNKNRASS